jgi:hypothetical protein
MNTTVSQRKKNTTPAAKIHPTRRNETKEEAPHIKTNSEGRGASVTDTASGVGGGRSLSPPSAAGLPQIVEVAQVGASTLGSQSQARHWAPQAAHRHVPPSSSSRQHHSTSQSLPHHSSGSEAESGASSRLKANRYQQCRPVTDDARLQAAAHQSSNTHRTRRAAALDIAESVEVKRRSSLQHDPQPNKRQRRSHSAPLRTCVPAVSSSSSSAMTAPDRSAEPTELAAPPDGRKRPRLIDGSQVAGQPLCKNPRTLDASAPFTRTRHVRARSGQFSQLSQRDSWSAVMALLQ